MKLVEMGESRTPRPEPFARDQLRACPMLCRQPAGLPSAGSPSVQSRVPRSGLLSDYATLVGAASSLNDASTAREDEAASTLTLAAYAARARVDWRLPGTSFCHLFNEARWHLGSRSLTTRPCRNHASPRARRLASRPRSLPERAFDDKSSLRSQPSRSSVSRPSRARYQPGQ